MNTLLDLISQAPARRTAIILSDAGPRISYESLREQVEGIASQLAAAGIQRGDRVALALPNGLPTIVCFLAASVAGTAAPLNPGYRRDEFAFFLEDTNAKVLIAPPEGGEEARKAAGNIPVLIADVDSDGKVRLTGAKGGARANPVPEPEDIALVLHTSGSTGRPKRVPLRHRNLAISSRNVANTYNLGPDDVALCVMPLFHVHGLVASTLGTLLTGGAIIVPPKFNPLSFWRTVQEHRATWYSAVPTIHQLLLARAKPGERPAGSEHLRFIRSCSAPLTPDTMRKLEESFGVPVLEAYGMTEAAHQMASNPLPPGARKPGSVGPGTGVQISIMDADGKHLAASEHGEVVIKGPNVIDGYENNPEANKSSFAEGWFRTGDQGMLDSDGYLKLIARIKELINRGGEKVSPVEVDEVLLSHPKIAEAVTFAVPHPTWGEEVSAAIVVKEPATEDEIVGFCKARLADFKRPKKIHIVDAIPRTATGKIQRRIVAQKVAGDPQ